MRKKSKAGWKRDFDSVINELETGKGEMNSGCFPSFLIGRKIIVMNSNGVTRRLAVGKKLSIYFWT